VTLALALMPLAMAGDINGRVVDTRGVGISGATVVAYDQRLSYATGTSDSDGGFEIRDLPTNKYRIRILPPRDANLVERYLPDAYDICEGEVFELRRKGVVGVGDAILEPGGSISGRVVNGSGEPVEGVLISTHATATADASQPRYADSDIDGNWTLSGLALDSSSDYFVEFEVDGWPDQFFGEAYDTEEAAIISFVSEETDSIELGENALLVGIAVSGTAIGPSGPIDSGFAEVYTPSQLVEIPIESGTWSAEGLPPGDVLAWAEVEGFATTYYGESDRPAARISALVEGTHVQNVELILPRESRIVGKIMAKGDLSEISLLAYNDDRTVAVSGEVSSDGVFEVNQLHGGRYTVQVFGEAAGLVSDELRDDDGNPLVFTVPDEDTLDLGEIDVPLGAVIKGTTMDAYTGEKIYGAFVYAESEEYGTITLAVADDKGRYDISGLRKGTYRLWADYQHYCDADADWVPRYWPDVVNPVLNGSVQVQTGEKVQWDPAMAPDADHDQMDDRWEGKHGLDRNRDDGGQDPDGDGFTNLEEYQLGTDPLDGRNGRGCGCGGGRSGLWLFGLLLFFRRRR